MHRILIADSLDPSGLELLREAGAEVHELTAAERPRLAEILGGLRRPGRAQLDPGRPPTLLARRQAPARWWAAPASASTTSTSPPPPSCGILVVNAPDRQPDLGHRAHLRAAARAGPQGARRRRLDEGGGVGPQELRRHRAPGQDPRHHRLRPHRPAGGGPRARLRDEGPGLRSVPRRGGGPPRARSSCCRSTSCWRRADVVTFHTPLTDQTRNLLDRARMALMKPGALLVNCGRGGWSTRRRCSRRWRPATWAARRSTSSPRSRPRTARLVRAPARWWRRRTSAPRPARRRSGSRPRPPDGARGALRLARGGGGQPAVPRRPARAASPTCAWASSSAAWPARSWAASLRALQVDLWGIDEALRRPVTVAVLKGALTPVPGRDGQLRQRRASWPRAAASRSCAPIHQRPRDYPHLVGVRLEGERRRGRAGRHALRRARSARGALRRLPARVPAGGPAAGAATTRTCRAWSASSAPCSATAGINIADIHLARGEGAADALAVLRLDQEPSAELLAHVRGAARGSPCPECRPGDEEQRRESCAGLRRSQRRARGLAGVGSHRGRRARRGRPRGGAARHRPGWLLAGGRGLGGGARRPASRRWSRSVCRWRRPCGTCWPRGAEVVFPDRPRHLGRGRHVPGPLRDARRRLRRLPASRRARWRWTSCCASGCTRRRECPWWSTARSPAPLSPPTPPRRSLASGALPLPLFVKPSVGGSSVGVRKVGRADDLAAAVEFALRFDDVALVERGVTGRELECAVLGYPELAASEVGEIVPGNEFYDYQDKYLQDKAQLRAPAPLAPALARAGAALWRSRPSRPSAASGMARVDFLLEEATGRGLGQRDQHAARLHRHFDVPAPVGPLGRALAGAGRPPGARRPGPPRRPPPAGSRHQGVPGGALPPPLSAMPGTAQLDHAATLAALCRDRAHCQRRPRAAADAPADHRRARAQLRLAVRRADLDRSGAARVRLRGADHRSLPPMSTSATAVPSAAASSERSRRRSARW